MRREVSYETRQKLAARALLYAIEGKVLKAEKIRQFLISIGKGHKAEGLNRVNERMPLHA